jgi:hypothetical protein
VTDPLDAVEAHLVAALGLSSGRAGVTFLGAERIDVLRSGPDPDGLFRYATLGMSRSPLPDPTSPLVDPDHGPRAELVLSVRGARDDALRALAMLAASPFVEGAVVVAGASLDLGEPLWPGAPFAAVLVAEPGGLVTDLGEVRFFPLLPMTPNEAAYKRVHGAAALEERWLAHGTDLRDPARRGVRLD